MISVDFEKLKELYDIVNRFEGIVSENLSRAEAQTSSITASGDRLLRHLNETKRFLDDEISRYQNLERRLNEKANAINFRGLKVVNAVNIDRISEGINSASPNLYEALFKPIVSGGDASLDNRSSKVELKSEKEENIIDKTLKAADGKVNSAVDMVENAANEIKNFAEEKIEDVDKAIKNVEEYLKSELAELTRQINSVLEEIFKTFENKNFQKAGTDFLILLVTDVQELTTNNKEELKVLPKIEGEYENKLSEDFDNFKADAWNEFSKSHPEGAKLLEDTSNKINDLEGIIKKSWELYKKIDPKHAGIVAGACTFVKETVEIPYDVAEFCGKQWYNLRTDTKGTLLSWLDTSQKIYGILNPQIPKTAEQLEFEGNLVNSIKNSVDKNLINGDEYTRYKFGTDVVLNIATLFSGKGALKAASEAGKVEDAVKLAKDASEMSKLEKGTSYAEKMSELSSKLKDLGKASEEMFKNTLSEILSLQKSMSDKFGDILEKLKGIDKDVEIKSEAKEIAETGGKSEVEEKTVNDIINEKNEVGSPVKVDDAKGVGENSKVDSKNAEEVNIDSKTDGMGKEGTEEVSKAELDTKLQKYVSDSFEGVGKEAQDNFNKYLRENVWCDKTLSNKEKIDIMKANFDKLTSEQKINLNVPNEVKVIKNPDYSNWGEWPDIDWPSFPGLNEDTAKSVYNEVTGKIEIPNDLDRLGSPYGNNLGVVENGYHCTQNERSICYIENGYARNGYKFDGTYYKDAIDAIKDFDIDNTEESVNKINSIIDMQNKINGTSLEKVDVADIVLWKDDYIKFENNPNLIKLCEEKGIDSTYGVMGEASPWTVNGKLITNGGAGQINTPVSVKTLEDIGLIKNIGGW